jgi:hypothetical protein
MTFSNNKTPVPDAIVSAISSTLRVLSTLALSTTLIVFLASLENVLNNHFNIMVIVLQFLANFYTLIPAVLFLPLLRTNTPFSLKSLRIIHTLGIWAFFTRKMTLSLFIVTLRLQSSWLLSRVFILFAWMVPLNFARANLVITSVAVALLSRSLLLMLNNRMARLNAIYVL